MTPPVTATPTLEVGEWIAVVDGKIVGRGETMQEAAVDAVNNGQQEYILQMVAPAGTYIL